jgi:DsbC/DsbD-like thiol-disulfide interchange protein
MSMAAAASKCHDADMRIQAALRKMAALAAAGFCLAAVAAHAQDASNWDQGSNSAARLIAGSRSANVLLGGIEFKLSPNWKTYWRTPGDSGVPPRFDFSKSDNVESVTVLWPAPVAFDDGAGGQSLGYKQQVVLPLRIAPKDASQPVTLRAQVDYAICEKLCVPVEATLELPFATTVSTQDSNLSHALARVPKPGHLGDAGKLGVRSVKLDEAGKRVLIDVIAPASENIRLFVEGPTPDWALPQPTRVGPSPDGSIRYAFALDGLPPNTEAKGAELRLTIAGDNDAYDIPVKLE